MRTNILLFLFLALFGSNCSLSAQAPRQVILANSNLYMAGNYVTVGSYEVATSQYRVFDSIPARFASDVVLDGQAGYIAADSLIVRYDLDNLQPTAQTRLPGVRKLAVSGNLLLATTGYGGDSTHFRAFDALSLQPVFQIDGISGDCEGLLVWGDTAFIAVPGPWGAASGKVALVGLTQQALLSEIDLDTLGKGIERLYASGGKIWTVNSIAYANPYGIVSEIDANSLQVTHHRVEFNTLHSPGPFQNMFYLRRGTDGIFQFDPTSGSVVDSLVIPGNFIAGTIDTLRAQWYFTESDYFSYGRMYRLAWDGSPIDTIEVGISPEALAIDYRLPAGIQELGQLHGLKSWPNPVLDELNLSWEEGIRNGWVEVSDLSGKILHKQQLTNPYGLKLQLNAWPQGVYFAKISGSGRHGVVRFVK